MIPLEAIKAATQAFIEHGTLIPALEAAAPHMLAASAAGLRGWYDERMSEESAPDVTLTDYEHGREVGTTEGILAAALLIEAETK